MYDSAEAPQIFQEDPLDWKPSSFKLKSWTETLTGYLYESNKLSQCLWRNLKLMRRGYTLEASINIEKVLSPDNIRKLWTKVCRKLRERGIVALWVREPSRKNHCNYHMVVKSQISQRAMEQAIEESMPSRAEVPYHKHVEPIRCQWSWCRYVTKAKTEGEFSGRLVSDKWRNKRLLFKAGLKLRKFDSIGDFWEKLKKDIWQDIIDKEKKIAEGLEKPNIGKLAQHVYDFLDRTVAIHKIKRSFGYSADSLAVRDWADKLFGNSHEGQSDRQLQEISEEFSVKQATPFWPSLTGFVRLALGWCCSFWKPRPVPVSSRSP